MEQLTAPRRRLYLFVDIVMVILSLPVAHQIYWWLFGRPSFLWGSQIFYQTYFFLFISWLAALLLFAEYPVRRLTTPWRELWVVIRVVIVSGLIFSSVSFMLKVDSFSRGFVSAELIVGGALMIAVRLVVRIILGAVRRSGSDIRTRVVIGDGSSAQRYITGVETNPRLGLRILGFIAEHRQDDSHFGVPFLGSLSELQSILERLSVDGVVIALPVSDKRTELVIQRCELLGVQVELMLDSMSSRITHSEVVSSMGIPRVVLSNIPHTADELALKRFTDIAISILAIIIFSPLLTFLALGVKLSDGGPVLFSQERAGLRGRTFKMYKFRSMRPDAERMKAELLHLNEMSGPVFKMAKDPRVTRFGAFLRRTSLDELPQFFNVLRGDMSLVGPRPPLPSEVNQYDFQYRRRLSVKPGLTCLWQISGRNEVDFDDWMRLDLRYIDTWSYWTDWRILFKTIPAVLKRKGAS